MRLTNAAPLPARCRLVGARFWTTDPAHPWAQSLDLQDGRICGVDAPPRADIPTIALDARAGTPVVVPGLIDTHLHLSLGALALAQLDLSEIRSRAAFEAAIADAARTLAPGRWLRAFGWHEANWGGERPTKDWLRRAGATPCVAYRMDQHACVVNGAVLERLTDCTAPAGGEIVRDDAGAPTGLFLEQAAWLLINPLLPFPPAADRAEATLRAFAHCHAFGLTSVGSMEYERDLREVYEPLATQRREDFTLRVLATILDRAWPVEYAYAREFVRDDLLTIVGFKSFADGTLGSRTARMLEPYADAAPTAAADAQRGMLVEFAAHSPERLRAWVRQTLAEGFSPSIHAIGDEAIRRALDAVEPEDHARLARFEHCQTLADADLPRMAGRIASMQPLHKADDARIALARLGASRMHRFFRFRDLLKCGARLAFGSDWPIVSCDPRLGIRAAVTGQSLDGVPCQTDQNLTVHEALMGYTRGAADALRAPAIGRLTPGAHADLCVFTQDPFGCNWSRDLPAVMATVVAGRIVHGSLAATRAHASAHLPK